MTSSRHFARLGLQLFSRIFHFAPSVLCLRHIDKKCTLRAYPGDGVIDGGLSITLDLRSMASFLHIGRDFILKLCPSGIPFAVFDSFSASYGLAPTSKTACLVDDHMHPVRFSESPVYNGVQEWAESEIKTAAAHLFAIYNDRSLGRARADVASRFIADSFSLAHFETAVRHFIKQFMEIQ